jgi:hypothetical protein
MKTTACFQIAMELLITLAAMAVLARVLLPAAGALAGSVLMMFATPAFSNPTLGLIGTLAALTLCLPQCLSRSGFP